MSDKTISIVSVIAMVAFVVMLWAALQPVGDKCIYGHDGYHRCIDPDHTSCDGLCECDGMECDAAELNDTLIELIGENPELIHSGRFYDIVRDYQLEITQGGNLIILWDGDTPIYVFDRHDDKTLFDVIDRNQ